MPVDPAVDRMLDGLTPLEPLEVPLLEASGCATADAVTVPTDVPEHSTARHDGYCVRMEDVVGAAIQNPRLVPVVGDTGPGDPPVLSVQPGFCVRITTGAAVPMGTEAVVPAGDTDGGLARVLVHRAPAEGDGVLPAGAALRGGEVLVPAHTRLRVQHLALLAAAGLDRVSVSPRPRVVVVPVGDELVEPGHPLLPGQWTDTAGTLLTSSLRESGALAFRVPPMASDVRPLIDTIEDQLVRADLVVLVDPAGLGERESVREVLAALGAVEMVATGMEPVDELGWGHVGPDSTPLVVVPHDPLAAFIAGEVVLRPIVRRLLGLTPERRPLVRAVHKGTTEGAVEHDRQRLVPAVLGVEDGVYAVHSVTTQGHPLAAAAEANALLVVPTGLGGCHDGDTVEVVVLERRHA
jgi:molybdopterin molybdotransferase